MGEVKFREYRRYLDQRQQANTAIMALLAGSQLAAHTLSLTDGSTQLIGSIFPNVRHIERFNLRTDVAKSVLEDAETHLASMALPHILAVHEDVQRVFLMLLADEGLLSRRRAREAAASSMHEAFQSATGASLDRHELAVYHLLRELRNCVIHRSGHADEALSRRVEAAACGGDVVWKRVSGRDLPVLEVGDRCALGHSEIVAALAVTKGLARAMNEGTQPCLRRSSWAALVVSDARSDGRLVGNPKQIVDQASGFARHYYGPVGLGREEVVEALIDAQMIRRRP